MENVQLSEIKDIVEKYTIFGRTTPDQKQEIIKCLQESGHKEICGLGKAGCCHYLQCKG